MAAIVSNVQALVITSLSKKNPDDFLSVLLKPVSCFKDNVQDYRMFVNSLAGLSPCKY